MGPHLLPPPHRPRAPRGPGGRGAPAASELRNPAEPPSPELYEAPVWPPPMRTPRGPRGAPERSQGPREVPPASSGLRSKCVVGHNEFAPKRIDPFPSGLPPAAVACGPHAPAPEPPQPSTPPEPTSRERHPLSAPLGDWSKLPWCSGLRLRHRARFGSFAHGMVCIRLWFPPGSACIRLCTHPALRNTGPFHGASCAFFRVPLSTSALQLWPAVTCPGPVAAR